MTVSTSLWLPEDVLSVDLAGRTAGLDTVPVEAGVAHHHLLLGGAEVPGGDDDGLVEEESCNTHH